MPEQVHSQAVVRLQPQQHHDKVKVVCTASHGGDGGQAMGVQHAGTGVQRTTNVQRTRGGRAAEVSVVQDWLYLAGARAVRPARLRELRVTCVVNSTVELPAVPLDGVDVVTVPVLDASTADLTMHLSAVADRLEEERMRGGRVLVHCVAGVSRSPALVMAYLVKHGGMSLRQAFQHVRSVRANVRPNAGFFRQLIEFEVGVRGRATVALIRHPDLGLTIPDVCEDELEVLKDRRWARLIQERRNFERVYA